VKHVIVVGALQYSYAQNEALARAAEGRSVYTPVKEHEVDRVRLGEIAHHLFQAVGRGAIRKSFERDCPPGCHLWIAVSSGGKAPIEAELLNGTFPGARWQPWTPVKSALKKSQAAVVNAIEAQLADNEQVTVTVGEIANHSGYSWNTVVRRLKEKRVNDELRDRAIEAKAPDQISSKGAVRLARFDKQ
jgi:hypothetical protein